MIRFAIMINCIYCFHVLPAAASTITFRYFGVGTGAVGANTVTSQPFELVAVGDTSTVSPVPNLPGVLMVKPVTATFQWGAFSGSITGSLRWFVNNNFGGTGLNDVNSQDLLDFGFVPALQTWDMRTSIGPLTPTVPLSFNGSVPSTAGTLTGTFSSLTFEANIVPEPTIQTLPAYAGCGGQPPTGQLQLSVVGLDRQTGRVEINGVDVRRPTNTPFSWTWGDGTTTQGWFPQVHMYSVTNRNYTIRVVSHEDDGSTECAELLVPFNRVAPGTITTDPPSSGAWPAGTGPFPSQTSDRLAPFSGRAVTFLGWAHAGSSTEVLPGASAPTLTLVYRYRLDYAQSVTIASVAVQGIAFNGPDSVLRLLDVNRKVLASVRTFGGNSFQTFILGTPGVVGRTFYLEEFDQSSDWRFRSNIVVNATPAPPTPIQLTVTALSESSGIWPAGTSFGPFTSQGVDPLGPFSAYSVHFLGWARPGASTEIMPGSGTVPSNASSLISRYRLNYNQPVSLSSILLQGAAFNGHDNLFRLLDVNRNVLASTRTSGDNSFQTFSLNTPGVTGQTFYLDEFDRSSDWRYRSNIVVNAAALEPGTCSYAVAPVNHTANDSKGTGNIVLTTQPGCSWTATSNAPSWLTVTPGAGSSSALLGFSVSANSSPVQRVGTISVAGKTVTVTQAGLTTCSYSISPASLTLGTSGGSFNVSVTTAPGCAWTAAGSLSWAGVSPNSASSTGAALVTVQGNPGGPRSGTLLIAGKTFTLSQAGFACGASDVSDKVRVSQGGLFRASPVNPIYARRITLTNGTLQPVPAPVYLVLDGLPKFDSFSCRYGCGVSPTTEITHCQSPSPTGSSLILFSPATIGPLQSVQLTITFIGDPASLGYTTRVLSGRPNQ